MKAEPTERSAEARRVGTVPPLMFVVPVWGDDYIQTYLSASLPSQLAAGNLPALSNSSENLYIIYTTATGEEKIRSNSAFVVLQELIKVVFCLIEDSNLENAKRQGRHYSIKTNCYRRALADASARGAACFFINADIVLADGFLRGAETALRQGKRVLEVMGPRARKNEVITILRRDYVRSGSPALTVPSPELTRIFLDNMHPLLDLHRMDGSGPPRHPSFLLWPVGDDGLLAHCFHLYPIMFHPGAGESRFEGTIDQDLAAKAFPDLADSLIPDDGDALFCCELSGEDHNVGSSHDRSFKAMMAFYDQHGADRNFQLLERRLILRGKTGSDRDWQEAARRADAFLRRIRLARRMDRIRRRVQGMADAILSKKPLSPYPPVHRALIDDLMGTSPGRRVLAIGPQTTAFLSDSQLDVTTLKGSGRANAQNPIEIDAHGDILVHPDLNRLLSGEDSWILPTEPADAAIAVGTLNMLPPSLDPALLRLMRNSLADGGLALIQASNALFSLYALNKVSAAFFMQDLIREDELLSGAGKARSAVRKGLNQVKRRFGGKVHAGRSTARNPLLLCEQMRAGGFTDVRMHYYHFHSVPPFAAQNFHDYFIASSLRQEDPHDWRSMFMCSAFLITGRRA